MLTAAVSAASFSAALPPVCALLSQLVSRTLAPSPPFLNIRVSIRPLVESSCQSASPVSAHESLFWNASFFSDKEIYETLYIWQGM